MEYEVDSNRAGQTWRVRILDNGALVARARHVGTGQVCVGRLSR